MRRSVLRTRDGASGHVLYCHPGVEMYGSDRMAAATVKGLVERNWTVSVVIPQDGRLGALFADAGASVIVRDLPVLRKTMLTPQGLVRLLAGAPRALLSMMTTIRETKADIVYANTIIQPGWLLASRLMGRPSIV